MLQPLDWLVILTYLGATLALGSWAAKRAGRNTVNFFLAGRSQPWWLLGASMVATTFSTDTPNLVTDITRTGGVAGNWVWWAFLLTGMLTAFVYARLWRRSGVTTDLELYELRYSGRTAAFLRGFRAVYLGLFFNVMVLATVSLAAIKIGAVMFGFSPLETLSVAGVVTVIFSALGGLTGVLVTDFFLFIVAMSGSIIAAVVAVRHVGGLDRLLASPLLSDKTAMLPSFDDPATWVPLFAVPLAVQWWASWYPGAEPGGGGYVAQRMLAARDERHAMGATLLFNIAHYALRPWPWILVALCSLIVFPDLAALRAAFPHLDPGVVRHDLAYPAMLTLLPIGFLGLVVGSLIAAYMSTVSTHLNWGASYAVNDLYRRFLRPRAGEKELVWMGRLVTVALMVLGALVALALENALQSFQILLQIGAGTGLLFILRWFWWRINAWSELTAMVVSFTVAVFFQLRAHDGGLESWQELLIGVAITTIAWIAVTLLTPPTDETVLRSFYRLARPGGPGWKALRQRAESAGEPLPNEGDGFRLGGGICAMLLGCVAVYGALFAVGHGLFGHPILALVLTGVSIIASTLLMRLWQRLS